MANSSFIKSFSVVDLENVKPVSVFLGESKTHLIITGRNGSGKTSILKAIQDEIGQIKGTAGNIASYRRNRREANEAHKNNPSAETINRVYAFSSYEYEKVLIDFESDTGFVSEKEVCVFFAANRLLEAAIPTSITKPNLPDNPGGVPVVNSMILQHLVNLQAQRAFAWSAGEHDAVKIMDGWFDSFVNALREVFERADLELKFDRENLTFDIVEGDKKYSFSSLSSGQSAILSIFSELLLRVESAGGNKKEIGGVILIDEPETHLHASLQKKVLAFLVKAFPQFQFIVTTHSPFIISSLKDTKILNLEDGCIYEDFSSFSYEAILEEYMQVDKYSIEVKRKVESIKKLLNAGDKSGAQKILNDLLVQLNTGNFSLSASAELALELGSIKLALKNVE